jgi:hypothetical protein
MTYLWWQRMETEEPSQDWIEELYEEADRNTPITLEITATISKVSPTPQNPNTVELKLDGRAYPYVTSGSPFGFIGSYTTVQKAKAELQHLVEDYKAWFSSYGRPVELKLKTTNNAEQQDLTQYIARKGGE